MILNFSSLFSNIDLHNRVRISEAEPKVDIIIAGKEEILLDVDNIFGNEQIYIKIHVNFFILDFFFFMMLDLIVVREKTNESYFISNVRLYLCEKRVRKKILKKWIRSRFKRDI